MKVLLLLLAVFVVYLGVTGKGKEFFITLMGGTVEKFNGGGGGGGSGFN